MIGYVVYARNAIGTGRANIDVAVGGYQGQSLWSHRTIGGKGHASIKSGVQAAHASFADGQSVTQNLIDRSLYAQQIKSSSYDIQIFSHQSILLHESQDNEQCGGRSENTQQG